LRRSESALGDGDLMWLDLGPGVLAFSRDPGFTCVVNLSDAAITLPVHESVLLTSGPLHNGELPSDTAAWLRTS
jgi:alpha-glucosidase